MLEVPRWHCNNLTDCGHTGPGCTCRSLSLLSPPWLLRAQQPCLAAACLIQGRVPQGEGGVLEFLVLDFLLVQSGSALALRM